MNVSSGKKPKAHPHLVVCYICGRNYSSASFSIHEPNCIKKFQLENPGKPVPKKPVIGGGDNETPVGGKMTAKQINDYNEACREQFLDQGREACPNCGRKFLPDRLPIHLRSCTPDGHFAREAQKRREKLAAQEKQSTAPASKPVSVAPKVVKPKPIANTDTVSPVKTSPVKSSPTKAAAPAAKPSAPAGTAKFCSECGNKFGEKDKFCSECGTARA